MLRKLGKMFRRQQSEGAPPYFASTPLTSDAKRNLFGKELADIAVTDGNTSEPHQQVMAMMRYIYEVGPSTSEIFRKPANSKKISQLVERIDQGDPSWVSDPNVNGLIVASVFKRYLREIPGKLLNNKNYKRWSYITENITKSESRISAIRRLISELDDERVALLRYVVCLLIRIQEYSTINLMTCYNLSVCIGPCLVWTNSTNRSHVERASVIIPKLVQFILENHEAIFGEGVTRLLSAAQLGKGASLSLDSVLMPDNQLLYQLNRKSRTTTSRHRGSLASRDSGLILYDDESTENLIDKTTPSNKTDTGEQINNNTQGMPSKEDSTECAISEKVGNSENTNTELTNQENTNPKKYLVRLTSLPYTVIGGNKIQSEYLYTTRIELPTTEEDPNPTLLQTDDSTPQYNQKDLHSIPERHNAVDKSIPERHSATTQSLSDRRNATDLSLPERRNATNQTVLARHNSANSYIPIRHNSEDSYIPMRHNSANLYRPAMYNSTDICIPVRHNSQKVNSKLVRAITRQRPRTVYYV